jgi:DNA-directed RNA polymerase specialized sigma24 family protein
VLREVEGWDYERIARQQNVPMGTVRSRLNRARAALRAHITAALDGEPRCIVSRQRQT